MMWKPAAIPALAAVAAALLPLPALSAAGAVEVGAPAPAFTATDSNGHRVRLSDYAGKIVILEWTRADCPFVEKHYITGNMQKLQQEARDDGAVWLTVNSTPAGKTGYLSAADANDEMRADGAAPTAYLLDSDQSMARAYYARTTPQIVIIGTDRKVAYNGPVDDTASADPADVANASQQVPRILRNLKENRQIRQSHRRPYGCSIHY